jgi:hypothetical protein
LGEVLRVGIRDDALCLIAQRKLGVTEECLVGSCDQASRHLQNGVGGSGLDAGGQFPGLGFQFGAERLGHADPLPE